MPALIVGLFAMALTGITALVIVSAASDDPVDGAPHGPSVTPRERKSHR